ncbi:hypothetical protein G7084_01275 [Weissella coleopterorum]|uniref:Uncharacterized protein n=1 Tax=Weissella coleopterorum TaxID=2714949 RepID=A0A6G8AYC8_9LACO|nr:hypothetical protein [Weissella coleopterorum]QIL50068.1 hypothetical protein G7084_01275 [Weissella coleopterorum]
MLTSTKNKLIGKTVSVEGTITESISNPIDYLLGSGARFDVKNVMLHYNDGIQHLNSIQVVIKNELPNFKLTHQKVKFSGIFSINGGVVNITDINKIHFVSNPIDIIKPTVDLFTEFYNNELKLDPLMVNATKFRQSNSNFSIKDFSFKNLLTDIFYIFSNKKNITPNTTDALKDLLDLMKLDIREIDFFKTLSSAQYNLTQSDINYISILKGHDNLYTSEPNKPLDLKNDSEIILNKLNNIDLSEFNLPKLDELKNYITNLLSTTTQFNERNKLNYKKQSLIDFIKNVSLDTATDNEINKLNTMIDLIKDK